MLSEPFLELLKTVVLAAGARAIYESSQYQQPVNTFHPRLKPKVRVHDVKPLSPEENYRRWSRKAVRKYAQAQEKKWRNWEKAMRS